jgi:hypothetical protein
VPDFVRKVGPGVAAIEPPSVDQLAETHGVFAHERSVAALELSLIGRVPGEGLVQDFGRFDLAGKISDEALTLPVNAFCDFENQIAAGGVSGAGQPVERRIRAGVIRGVLADGGHQERRSARGELLQKVIEIEGVHRAIQVRDGRTLFRRGAGGDPVAHHPPAA